jgi:N-acetylglucosaminyldiphosphoundecaprenol N-acetyl-beta-D-mannosaminyltransferase
MSLRYGDLSWDSAETLDAPTQEVRTISGSNTAVQNADRSPMRSAPLPTVRLRGIDLHAITEAGCIQYILQALDQRRGGVVVTPNLDHLRRCLKDIRFGALVAEADLVVADGMPLIWASRLQGTPLPERVAGSDLISSLSAAAAERGRAIFMLGGAPTTAEGAARVLQQRHPNLKVAGAHCPPVGFEEDDKAIQEMIAQLQAAKPDIVYVALGSPKQELLIEQLRRLLPEAWWLGVGNSFSFLCGHVPRAPLWMQKSGLEWTHRLLHEPKRLFKRYVVVGLPFAVSMLSAALGKRIARRFSKESDSPSPSMRSVAEEIDSQPAVARAIHSVHSNGNGNGHAVHNVSGRHGAHHSSGGAEKSTLHKLRGLILLGGSLRPTSLSSNIGRSILDLPVDAEGSILKHWTIQAAELVKLAGLETLPIRVLVDQVSPAPTSDSATDVCPLKVEQDRSEYRGTGGVLAELAEEYAADDLVLVANAAQIMLEPLTAIATALDRCQGEVGLVAHEDGTPSSVMLLNGAALRLIPCGGFVDMKEQAMPMIASRMEVGVVHKRHPTALPIRTLEDYIAALRQHHGRLEGKRPSTDPLAEGWRPIFSVVEPGAVVDPLARLHDSVVLRDGRVEAGAVLVRSIVCGGGTLRKDHPAVDQFITSDKTGSRRRN